MTDIIYLTAILGFFAVAAAYTRACEKLRGDRP